MPPDVLSLGASILKVHLWFHPFNQTHANHYYSFLLQPYHSDYKLQLPMLLPILRRLRRSTCNLVLVQQLIFCFHFLQSFFLSFSPSHYLCLTSNGATLMLKKLLQNICAQLVSDLPSYLLGFLLHITLNEGTGEWDYSSFCNSGSACKLDVHLT